MSIKDKYYIEHVNKVIDKESQTLILNNHYSKSYKSLMQKHVFKLCDKSGTLVGIAVYGKPISRHYSSEVIELRKLCLIDNTPKNTESYFISKTIKWLEKNTDYVYIVTFADPNYGHNGTIYKASNWDFDGYEDSPNPRVVKHGKKCYHIRQMYQKSKGVYTPSSLKIQQLISSGKAKIIPQQLKLRYKYYFRN